MFKTLNNSLLMRSNKLDLFSLFKKLINNNFLHFLKIKYQPSNNIKIKIFIKSIFRKVFLFLNKVNKRNDFGNLFSKMYSKIDYRLSVQPFPIFLWQNIIPILQWVNTIVFINFSATSYLHFFLFPVTLFLKRPRVILHEFC